MAHSQISTSIKERSLNLIREFASKPEHQSPSSSWYCIAACAFTASGQGPLVADLYLAAIAPFSNDAGARKLILRRMKESLIKSSFIFGVPRLLNAFFPLMKVVPDAESQDNTNLRTTDQIPSFDSVTERGEAYMRHVFGSTDLTTFLTTLSENWPDLRNLIVNDIYGMYQAEVSIINRIETSQLNVASLVPMDCPAEVGWHLRGLINNGGSLGQLEEALEIARRVAEVCEVGLKSELPRVEDVVGKERLISKDG